MTTILTIAIAIWLVRAAWQIVAGILQILAGIATSLLAFLIYLLAGVAEISSALWRTAFPKTND